MMKVSLLVLTAALVGAPEVDAEALLTRARAEYEALEFERVLRTTEGLSRALAAGEAYFEAQVLRGSAFAVLGRIVDAEGPFRLVLRARPDFDLPAGTPPKILSVFRKVQADERALARELEQIRRQRLRDELEVTPRLPKAHPGGLAMPVAVEVIDPRGGVARVTLSYRMGLTGDYDVVSLARDGRVWRADIGAERTSSPDGVVMCWFVSVFTHDGARVFDVGRPERPSVTQVEPGVPGDHAAITSRWWFWTAVAAAVAAGTAAAVVIATEQGRLPDSDLGEVSFR